MLSNLQKSLHQIRSIIKQNSDLRKFIYYDNYDPLAGAEVSVEIINDYIFLSPVFDTTEEPYNKNTFISINLNDFAEDDELFQGSLQINVMSQNSLWDITDYKIRPLAIIDIIRDLLDGTKFNISHKLSFDRIQIVVLDKNIAGYIMFFNIVEGSGWLNEGF